MPRRLYLSGLLAASVLLGCDDDDGTPVGDTGGDATSGSESSTSAADSSSGAADETSTGEPQPQTPRELCGLPAVGPDSACSGAVCFEHYPGSAPGCQVDAEQCPSNPLAEALTGICNRAGEGTVFLFYYADASLDDDAISMAQAASEGSCTGTGGVWCDVWQPGG